jgi:GntR family transcriptional regulator
MPGPDDVIDHEGRLAPYRQLAEIIKARIARGDWKPGRPMASETQLMQEYGLARSTVRKAVALLAREGVVEVEPRRGTYVAE